MEEKKEEEIFTSEALNAEFLALTSEFSKKYKDLITKIEHRTGVLAEIANFDPNGSNYPNSTSYMMNQWENKTTLYRGGASGVAYNAAGFAANGDYITVISEGTTIRFEKNKVNLGACNFPNPPPKEPLFPVIECDYPVSVTLVPDY